MQQWHSLSDFVAMGGYGLYIWGAYGLTLVCMLAEPWMAWRRKQQAWRRATRHEEAS